jgi:hypothetical protein
MGQSIFLEPWLFFFFSFLDPWIHSFSFKKKKNMFWVDWPTCKSTYQTCNLLKTNLNKKILKPKKQHNEEQYYNLKNKNKN